MIQNQRSAREATVRTRQRCFWRGVVITLCGVIASVGAEEVVLDAPVPIPGVTNGSQESPDVALWASGDAIVVWRDSRGPGSVNVRARRFDSAGEPIGASFRVSEASEGVMQGYPEVAVTDDGGFLVVWERLGGSAAASGIRARRYDDQAQALGAVYPVEEGVSAAERQPALSKAPDGSFLVTYSVTGDSLRGRRLDPDGMPVGAELLLDTGDHFAGSSVSHNDNGDVLAVWRRTGGPAGRLFDSAGLPLGPEIDLPGMPSISTRPTSTFAGGRFLATAVTDGQAQGQFFDPAGTPLGSPFVIGDDVFTLLGVAGAPSTNDEVQLVWTGPDGLGVGIFTGRFSNTGVLVDDVRRVNSSTSGDNLQPDVAVDDTGRPVIVWRGRVNGAVGVLGCFELPGEEIFLDGFESGDTSAWRTTVP